MSSFPAADDSALFSVCMLCSNDSATVKDSLDGLLSLSKRRRLEIVVTDNTSRDGSQDILRRYRDSGSITLVEKRCTRGEGRQLAFEASRGEFVLGHMDCDDTFDPDGLDNLLHLYTSTYAGMMVMTQKRGSDEASNITIAPRVLLDQIGGWRDLNWGEDWDLWARAAGLNKYVYIPYPTARAPHRSIKVRYGLYDSQLRRLGMRLEKYSDAIKSGRKMFKPKERISLPQRFTYWVAKAEVSLGRSRLTPVPDPDFSEFPVT